MNNKNNNKGFTLIELIIAMSILSIVLTIGYNIINKSSSVINLQQYITQNQSVANLVNTYISKDIEESKSVSQKEQIDNNTYRYTITKVNNSIEYKIELGNKNGKKVYNLIRNDGNSSIEIISNQIRDSNEPFIINIKNNKIYEIKILYSENNKLKEYSFDVSSRLSSNSGGNTSGGEDGNEEDDILKPIPEDIPSLPEGVGPNTHYIGFWMADPNNQKQNNIYTWIDNSFEKGSSNSQENSISASINPGSENAYEYSFIENTKVEGNITPKSKVEFLSIYVSKGTEVKDFEIKSSQSSGSITILNTSTRDSSNGKLNLSGGANDGIWYNCQVNGNISSFEVTSGSLSINNTTDKGFVLIVYSEKPQDYGDADIIIEYNRESGITNNDEFILRNRVKVKKEINTYETVEEFYDKHYTSNVKTVLLNFTHEHPKNIFVQIEKLRDARIYNIYGFDLYDEDNDIKEVVFTLEGNIYIKDTSKLSEIEHKKKYSMKFSSQNDRFENHVIVSGLKEGESGLLKINLIR